MGSVVEMLKKFSETFYNPLHDRKKRRVVLHYLSALWNDFLLVTV